MYTNNMNNSYLDAVKYRLTSDGYTISQLNLPYGIAVVGYQSKFKWTWFATKLHLFTIVLSMPEIDAAKLEQFIGESVNYANSQKGAFRGMQVGIAIIPTIIAERVSEDARRAVTSRPAKKWALLNLPVIIDSSDNKVLTYEGKMIGGQAM